MKQFLKLVCNGLGKSSSSLTLKPDFRRGREGLYIIRLFDRQKLIAQTKISVADWAGDFLFLSMLLPHRP